MNLICTRQAEVISALSYRVLNSPPDRSVFSSINLYIYIYGGEL